MNHQPPYTFSVDLAVVESLGINLYSNAAAVLSEMVANAWDADANEVKIDWNEANDRIIVEDDGRGMSADQLNKQYLTVAYKKRTEEGVRSPEHDRPFMGRKGIGKLSVFSLANSVTVYSVQNGEANGLTIDVADLRKSIEDKETYHPTAAQQLPADLPPRGTRIVLEKLNKRRASVSLAALRKRLARRFDVLNFDKDDPKRFVVVINTKQVTYEDREDLKRLQYIWQLGTKEIPAHRLPKVKKDWLVTDNVIDSTQGWMLEGWFGTVEKPADLTDEEDDQESLRNIIILARKRPIQEGILDQLDFNKLFGNYVTGQIRAEFLDLDDGSDDIATSDRQRLIEDDPRVQQLLRKLREMFNTAAEQWSTERPAQKFKELTDAYPAVRDWVNDRPEGQRDSARRLISTVAALELETESQRPELFKSSVLAFERLALDSTTDQLKQFADGLFAVDILPLLANVRAYEDALYVQILRSRLGAIEKLEHMINKDELEKVLQEHLFENMWLLDPSWEGATEDKDMEISLSRIRGGTLFSKDEKENQQQGRIDIQYRSAAGVHMIVELKKYGRTVSLDELRTQGAKYHQALTEVLEKQDEPVRQTNVVFVLGQFPSLPYTGTKTAKQFINDELSHINGRVLYYDELLATAQKRYRDYRERKKDLTRIDTVLAELDSYREKVTTADDTAPPQNPDGL